ncbi:MAG: hypothetical protein U1G07_13635 [Verrucomicrobiota bacterium]
MNLLTNDPWRSISNITAPASSPLTNTIILCIVAARRAGNFETAAKIPASEAVCSPPPTALPPCDSRMNPGIAQVPTVDASLWWNWSPSRSGAASPVDTAGSAINTVLAVYTNNTLRTLPGRSRPSMTPGCLARVCKVTCNFDAISWITYRIAVAGFDGERGWGIPRGVEPGGKPTPTRP